MITGVHEVVSGAVSDVVSDAVSDVHEAVRKAQSRREQLREQTDHKIMKATFLRGHGHQWLMLAAPHVTAQYSGIW